MKKFLITFLFVVSGNLWCMEPEKPQLPEIVWIQTNDDAQFEVPIELVQRSMTFKNMLEDIGYETTQDLPMPLSNIDSKIFEHITIALVLPSVSTVLNELSLEDLIAFTNAVNFLDIPDLLQESMSQLHERVVSLDDWNMILDDLQDNLVKQFWEESNVFKWVMSKVSIEGLRRRFNHDGVIFSPDGNYIISWIGGIPRIGGEGTIGIWDVNNKFKQVGNDLEHSQVREVIFSQDGRYMVSWSTREGTIKLWDVKNNFKQVGNALQHKRVMSVIFSQDSRYLISWSTDPGTIKIWDVNNNFEQVGSDLAHGRVIDVIFSQDGRYMVSWSTSEGTIKIWDVKNKFKQAGNDLVHEAVNGVIFSPDGRYMVSWSSFKRTIKIWDVKNFEQVGSDLKSGDVIFSSDGRYMVSWSRGEGIIKLWDVKNNFTQVGDDLEHKAIYQSVFSPDGRYLISVGYGAIKVWDVQNNFEQVGYDLDHRHVREVILSPDGRYMVSQAEKAVKIRDFGIILQLQSITFDQIRLLLDIYYTRAKKQLQIPEQLYQAYGALSPEMKRFVRRFAPQYHNAFDKIDASIVLRFEQEEELGFD